VSGKAWKQFETRVAKMLDGRRFWANSGEQIDVESEDCVVQCKNVVRMSLTALTQLAWDAERQGKVKGKTGIVAVKLRCGKGIETPVLFVVTAEQLREEP
jgi:hypothetical protein